MTTKELIEQFLIYSSIVFKEGLLWENFKDDIEKKLLKIVVTSRNQTLQIMCYELEHRSKNFMKAAETNLVTDIVHYKMKAQDYLEVKELLATFIEPLS